MEPAKTERKHLITNQVYRILQSLSREKILTGLGQTRKGSQMYFDNIGQEIEKAAQSPQIISKATPKKSPLVVAIDKGMEVLKNRIASDIGTRLKDFRESKHWKQEEMLRHCPYHKMSSSAYSKWENGGNSPDISFLVYIHEEYHVDLNWLIAGDSSKPEMPPEIVQAFDDFKKAFEAFQNRN